MAALEIDSSGFFRLIAFVVTFLLIYITRPAGLWKWCRFLTAYVYLLLHKRKLAPRFPPHNLWKKKPSLHELGFIPHPTEYQVENPQKTFDAKCCDGIHFIGMDAEQNFLDVAITNIGNDKANVWIVLKLSDGTVYELPCQPETRHTSTSSEHGFNAAGLQIRCCSPLRRWRISFNGVLKRRYQEKERSENKLVHAKFSFIWMGVTLIHDNARDYSAVELAKAFDLASISRLDITQFEEVQNCYEQWGQLVGTVQFDGKPETELYLWSVRIRNLENPVWDNDLHFVKMFLYFKDGMPLKIETMSLKNFFSNYFSGYSVTAGGKEKALSECSVQLQQLIEEKVPSKYFFSFALDSGIQNVTTSVDFMYQLYLGPVNERKLSIYHVKARINGEEDGYGVIICGLKSKQSARVPFQPPNIILKDKGYVPSRKCKILSLEDEHCQSSLVAGGKGCSLALLTALSVHTFEFQVPKGFVVTTAAFEEHMDMNPHLADAVRRLISVSSEGDASDLKSECEKCFHEFASTDLSVSLKSEITAKISRFSHTEMTKFAVRSSALGEDSEDMSAAGQMLTILGVKTLENVYQAISKCWASHFRYEAVQYCRQYGQPLNSPMAVVVQEMVPADAAGVMFTVDPVTGNPMYPCITANFGLGETVVSSTADPDTFILKRMEDGSVLLHDLKRGVKRTRIFLKDDGGVQEILCDSGQETECLSKDMVLKIGTVGLMVENCFSGPRDIEWAVHKEKLFLLQARPVTTLHTETEFELTHELDSPARSSYEYWTRANTGEVFCGASSPLGISLVVLGMDIFGQRNFIVRQKPKNFSYVPYYCHWLPTTHRQVTLSLIDTLFRTNEEKITTAQKAFEVALFGRTVGTDEMHRCGVKKFGYISRRQKMFSMVSLLYFSFRIPWKIEEVHKKVWEFTVPLEKFTSPMEVYNSLQEQLQFYGEVSGIHGLSTYLSSFYNVLMLSLLARGKEVWDNELYSDFATLLSTCTDVESADVPSSLQDLAKAVYSVDAAAFATAPVEVAHTLLKNDPGVAGQKFREFLHKHGHRCLKEFDVYAVSWSMEPEKLVKVLQEMVRSPDILTSKSKEHTSTGEAIAKLKTPLSTSSKILLKIVLPWSRKAVGHREKTKSIIIKVVDWMRRSCSHLGNLLVHDGLLPRRELIYFLTFEEIKLLIENRNPALVSRAVRRSRIHAHLDSLKFPEIIVGIPKPVSEERNDLDNCLSTFELEGTPVCPGIVKARARVVQSLEKAAEIKPGEILVAYSTDIGWSPYFPLLSGVITVLGGLISHGAVVAREYGLPCVVGVQRATSLLKTGDLIILNGSTGKVIKIDESGDKHKAL